MFPFVTPIVLHNLVVQRDLYNTAASQMSSGYDLWAFWDDNKEKLRAWYEVAQNVALIQTSSAFIERVFSIFRACMDARQDKPYSDRIEAATLLKCNRASERRN